MTVLVLARFCEENWSNYFDHRLYHWKYTTSNLTLMLGFWCMCQIGPKPKVEIKMMSPYHSVEKECRMSNLTLMYLLGSVCCQKIHGSCSWRSVLSVICDRNDHFNPRKSQKSFRKCFGHKDRKLKNFRKPRKLKKITGGEKSLIFLPSDAESFRSMTFRSELRFLI